MTPTFRARLGLATAAGLVLAGSFAAPAMAAGRGTVQGTYTTDGGAPIADAYVAVWDADYNVLRDAYTDASGRYTVRNVTSGGVRLQFQHDGIQQWAQRALDYDSATTFTLGDGQSLTVNERQLPTGTVAGTVREPSGEPAAWYAAVIHQEDSKTYAYADENGHFSAQVLPGDYRVSFERDATEQWWPGKADPAAAAPVTVRANETTTVDDTFLPGGTLTGKLAAADGTPLSGAQVGLFRSYDPENPNPSWVFDTSTGEDGSYAFLNVLPGAWRLAFRPEGGSDWQWLHETADPALATAFTVAAGQETVADDKQFRPATLTGRLVDSAGAPLAGVTVLASVASDEWADPRETTTAADGTWRLTGVRPAGYRIGFRNAAGTRTQWHEGLVKAGSGATVTVDETWLPGASLFVNALDSATLEPAAGFCVWVHGPDAEKCTEGSELTIDDLPAGTFDVTFDTPQGSFYLEDRVGGRVTLVPGQTAEMTTQLTLGGKITATVTDAATGAPLRRACVALTQPGDGGLGDGYGDCSNAAGKFTTQAQKPGVYQVFIHAPDGYGDQWAGKTGGTGDQRVAAKITVKPGKVAQAPAILIDRPGTIAGTVTDEQGTPIPSANVGISAWGYGVGGGPNDVDADEQGRYTIGGLGPYAWPLVFTTNGHPRQWSGNVGNRFQASAIPVTAGGTANYDIALRPGVQITGTVTVKDGLPPNAWRLTAMNAATGDDMGVIDATADGSYAMSVLGGQQIKMHWSLYDYEAGIDQYGWHDNATDFASATKVPVPAELDLHIGR